MWHHMTVNWWWGTQVHMRWRSLFSGDDKPCAMLLLYYIGVCACFRTFRARLKTGVDVFLTTLLWYDGTQEMDIKVALGARPHDWRTKYHPDIIPPWTKSPLAPFYLTRTKSLQSVKTYPISQSTLSSHLKCWLDFRRVLGSWKIYIGSARRLGAHGR